MAQESPAGSQRGRTFMGALPFALLVLRLVVGWHFLYEGLSKLFTPGWSAAGYLASSGWFLSDVFHWMAESPAVLPWVDFLNVWGLILIGADLCGMDIDIE